MFALQKSEEKLALITDNATETIWLLDLDYQTQYISPSTFRLCGYQDEEVDDCSVMDLTTNNSFGKIMTLAMSLDPQKIKDPNFKFVGSTEVELVRKDRSTFWSEINFSVVRNNEGQHTGYLIVGHDIGDRVIFQQRLMESELKYRTLFENMRDGFVLFGLAEATTVACRFEEANRNFLKIFNDDENYLFKKGKLLTPSINNCFSQEQVALFVRVAKSGHSEHFEYTHHQSGRIYNVVAFAPQMGSCAATFQDITERKESEKRTHYLANHDILTGLLNRSSFEEEIAEIERDITQTYGVVMIDANNLKITNDTFGHNEGDNILKRTAVVLNSVFEDCLVFRIGGDEFAVFLKGKTVLPEEEILQTLEQKIKVHNLKYLKPHFLSLSIGVALNRGENLPQELIRIADQKMYQHKAAQKKASSPLKLELIS